MADEGKTKDYIAWRCTLVEFEWARLSDESTPGKDYFDGLDEVDQITIHRIWNYIGIGPDRFRNREKFKAIEGERNLQEIKSRQARLFTAWAPKKIQTIRRLLLLCGISQPKKQKRLRPEDIERARRIRDEHIKHWEQAK